MRFNFPDLPTDKHTATLEVNWYLENYVGCNRLTADGRNFIFSSSANPGIVYVPLSGALPFEQGIPVLTKIKDRRESVLANTPGRFIVADSPGLSSRPNPIYALPDYEEVNANVWEIESIARQYRLDPDFIKAVVWMESTHGYYDRAWGSRNETIRPMNVHARLWAQLGIDRTVLHDRRMNLAAGVHIISAIWERTEDPSYEKVATLYNELGATAVNQYGKTVDFYRTDKPWLRYGVPAPPPKKP